jgi:NAD(P)-dependent dehydrogenase (short-subunit alcohol dehydrogenase family)
VPRALEGKVAVVLDAGEPRGRALAIRLAALGVRVVAVGRVEKALGETVGEIAYAGDAWGRLDIVVETRTDAGGA